MRKNKIKGNFNVFINQAKTTISKLLPGLDKFKGNQNKYRMLAWAIYSDKLQIIQAMYSAGYAKDKIFNEANLLVKYFNDNYEVVKIVGYSSIARFFAILILLDLQSDNLDDLLAKLKSDSSYDKFLGFLLSYFDSSIEFENRAYEFPDYYKSIYEFNDSSEVASYLKNKWYKNQEDEPWHDNHLLKRDDLYFGYWAWDVAAVVKIKGIDPSPLEGVDYFPYDALVW